MSPLKHVLYSTYIDIVSFILFCGVQILRGVNRIGGFFKTDKQIDC